MVTALVTLVSAVRDVMSPLAPLAAATRAVRAAAAVVCPVPPLAIGIVPVREMFGAVPPLEASGLLAVTLVIVPDPVPHVGQVKAPVAAFKTSGDAALTANVPVAFGRVRVGVPATACGMMLTVPLVV